MWTFHIKSGPNLHHKAVRVIVVAAVIVIIIIIIIIIIIFCHLGFHLNSAFDFQRPNKYPILFI
jgi:hypothetical protein